MSKEKEIKRLRKCIFDLQLRGDYRAANKFIKKVDEIKNGKK